MSPGTEATQAIEKRFGADILDSSGAVDRRKLGPIVFADPAARRDLEAIVHPAVRRAIEAGLRAFEHSSGARFAIVDIPLLFETHREKEFARVIVAACSSATQMSRLMDRGLSEPDAELRLAAQLPIAEKVGKADYVIRTDGSFPETAAQIDEVFRSLNTL